MAHRTTGLSRIAARLRPGTARASRLEPFALLGLVFVACVVAASLPGADGAAAASSTSPAGLAANATASPSPSIATPTPSPTDVLSENPAESPSPFIEATPVPSSTPHPVFTFVALGDSLTAWPASNPWPTRLDAMDPYLRLVHNGGVPGNTTAQMLARFSSEVAAYSPDVLFLLGGTNDIGNNLSPDAAIANLKAIVDAAKALGIRVIMMTIPPDAYPSYVERVQSFNAQLTHLANLEQVVIVDIYTPLATASGVYQPEYTVDGLHFSDDGCQVMAQTVYIRVRRLGM